ncbi:hypothetical protein H072_1040 [Dactylellina haptotyla CBS 200.50]|uniref:Uncharacterized protein n=1 Tax=Dactylellina haptotyla (strain CBS 200.50) TaxID=1284197 RepID=S8AQ97_DACHA|nr:hypothetical protein H072_1040 [Dactylellina haptotyla CBS 200.50]
MLLGRRLSPVRLIVYVFLLGVTVTFFSSLSPVPIPVPESASASFEKVRNKGKEIFGPNLPSWYGPGAHKSPEPTNGTASTSTWYEHWSWLNPFASSADYSESRTVLPPLPPRCPIYAYYDKDIKASQQTHTDDVVMLAWRRAWWAAGFEPIILNPSDAKQHGMYRKVKGQLGKNQEKLEYNILRWLAWDRMGNGILSDFRIFPMPTNSDPVIPFLRRCDFGMTATRFRTLGSGIFAASAPVIKSVVKNITSTDLSKLPEDRVSPAQIATDLFTVDEPPASLAYYSTKNVAEKYKELQPSQLPRLINAHLHTHFQNQYPHGIYVLNAIKPDSDVLSLESYKVGQKLALCPESPFPTSCPPNVKEGECKLCDGKMPVDLVKEYKNGTSAFTVGGIPHPMTLQGFIYGRLVHEVSFVRKNSTRDVFLKVVTKDFAKEGTGAGYRAVKIKEVIASSLSSVQDRMSGTGIVDSIWTSVEKGWDVKEIEWIMGFTFPETIPPSPHLNQDKAEVTKHTQIFEDAKHAVRAETKGLKRLRGAIESWSLGDFEVWKFVRAFEERRKSERAAYIKKEKGFGKGLERR